MAALRDMPLGSAAPQGEVERLREARNAALEEAATVAIHNSNFGHVEGNKRAFKIADQILAERKFNPKQEASMSDRYIPTPHDGQYRPGDLINGRRRSEERRVGEGCVRKCRFRWTPAH